MMTHKDLVIRAKQWLLSTGRCRLALAEPRIIWTCEEPDAIGWKGRDDSVVIECKMSRKDFLKDRKKPCTRLQCRLGKYRYYMAPKGVLKADDMPEGWGLLEVCGERIFLRVAPALFRSPERNITAEIALLVAATQCRSMSMKRNMANGAAVGCA